MKFGAAIVFILPKWEYIELYHKLIIVHFNSAYTTSIELLKDVYFV